MPFVSLIIPVYNAEKYLRRCLNSAMEQTFQDMEIIVVNDGSQDTSLKICQFVQEISIPHSFPKRLPHILPFLRVM